MPQHDFTQGSLMKKMLVFAGPFFLANLLQMSYQFIDSLWVGNLLGSDALAAVSLSSTLIFAVLSFIIGMNRASLTILSQHKGAQEQTGLKASLNAFVVSLGALAVLLGLAGILFAGELLHLLGTPADIMPAATLYLQINFIGILFLFGYNFISTVLRALGDSRTPVRFVVIAVILNTILDPVFMSVLGWGIAGAAVATIVAQGVAFLYGLIVALKDDRIPFVKPYFPERSYLKAVFRLGVPGGLQTLSISGGSAAIMAVVAIFGSDVIAGFGAAQRISHLIMIISMTMGSVVTSMAGQNMGAGRWDRVRVVTRYGLCLTVGMAAVMSTFVFSAAGFLIRLFVNDPATITFGHDFLQAVVFFYPFLAINFALNGVVRASGAMFQVLVLNLISFWALRVPLSYLFSAWYGEIGLAYGIGVSFMISAVVASGYFLFGGWRQTTIIPET